MTTHLLKKYTLIFTLIGVFIHSQAIELPKHFQTKNNVFLSDSNRLYFTFDNSNFLLNNEFFSDVFTGYTLIGYFANPELKYHLTNNFSIEGGVHLLKYHGLKNFTTVAPTYTVNYHKKNFALLMGTLQGTINHQLPDPMYFYENYFTDNLENGVQVIWRKNRFNFDTWIDWRSFIFENDDKQEVLTAGFVADYDILKKTSFTLTIPVSVLATHQGGQINTTGAYLKTLLNYSYGLRATKSTNNTFLTTIETEINGIGFYDNSHVIQSIYPNGWGILSNLRLKHNQSFLRMGYWHSYHFLSMMGHPMYQSFSKKGSEFNKIYRDLIIAEIYYAKTIYKGVHLGLSYEGFYDFETNTIDFATGLTLNINQQFLMQHFKK